jgi:predicted GNAT family acetyltransferase
MSRARLVLGEENAVGDFWAAARDRLPSPREDRPGQPVYVLEEPPEPGDTGLRAATPDDLELLVPACAQAYREELDVDPLESDAESYRWRTRTQIDDGRSWLWAEGGTILFKAEASAWTPSAVQLQQVWVDPGVRGRGYAQRGMRDLCRLLLERVPAVCLFVRADNAPAIRLYERIGMRHTISYRTLVFID